MAQEPHMKREGDTLIVPYVGAQPIYDEVTGIYRMPSVITPETLAAQRAERSRRIQEAVAERQADEAALSTRREHEAQERGAAELEAYRVDARAAWMSNGGDDAGFERNWPKLRDERLSERAREQMTFRERAVQERVAAQKASGLFEGF